MPIDERHEAPVAMWLRLLDGEAAARADRFRRAVDRTRHIAAHALLRAVLAAATDRVPADVVLRRDEHSKLHLVDGQGIDFSLTHTQGLVAVAVHDRPVGCDAEPVDRHVDAAVMRLLAPTERQWLDGVVSHERHRRFLELWVLKEAFAKAMGLGLALELASYAIDASATPSLVSAPAACGPREEWRFLRPEIGVSHVLALATRDAPSSAPLDMIRLTPDRLTELACGRDDALMSGWGRIVQQ